MDEYDLDTFDSSEGSDHDYFYNISIKEDTYISLDDETHHVNNNDDCDSRDINSIDISDSERSYSGSIENDEMHHVNHNFESGSQDINSIDISDSERSYNGSIENDEMYHVNNDDESNNQDINSIDISDSEGSYSDSIKNDEMHHVNNNFDSGSQDINSIDISNSEMSYSDRFESNCDDENSDELLLYDVDTSDYKNDPGNKNIVNSKIYYNKQYQQNYDDSNKCMYTDHEMDDCDEYEFVKSEVNDDHNDDSELDDYNDDTQSFIKHLDEDYACIDHGWSDYSDNDSEWNSKIIKCMDAKNESLMDQFFDSGNESNIYLDSDSQMEPSSSMRLSESKTNDIDNIHFLGNGNNKTDNINNADSDDNTNHSRSEEKVNLNLDSSDFEKEPNSIGSDNGRKRTSLPSNTDISHIEPKKFKIELESCVVESKLKSLNATVQISDKIESELNHNDVTPETSCGQKTSVYKAGITTSNNIDLIAASEVEHDLGNASSSNNTNNAECHHNLNQPQTDQERLLNLDRNDLDYIDSNSDNRTVLLPSNTDVTLTELKNIKLNGPVVVSEFDLLDDMGEVPAKIKNTDDTNHHSPADSPSSESTCMQDLLLNESKIPKHSQVKRNHLILMDILRSFKVEINEDDLTNNKQGIVDWTKELLPSDLEYSHIKNKFDLCMKSGTRSQCQNYVVKSIKQVVNPYLLAHFKVGKEKKREREFCVHEEELYHGTQKENIMSICRDNFNWRKCGTHFGTKFGKGVSFAKYATFASFYPKGLEGTPRAMIVSKILYVKKQLGNSCMTVPDEGYDTTINSKGEVVVKYDDAEFCPLYVIYYS